MQIDINAVDSVQDINFYPMWEIFVPTMSNDGKPYTTRFHRVWDQKVREIGDGGLSVLPVINGQWTNQEGKLFKERMIPVRISCTEEAIEKVIQFTMGYYNQEVVMAYKVSDKVILRHRESEKNLRNKLKNFREERKYIKKQLLGSWGHSILADNITKIDNRIYEVEQILKALYGTRKRT